MDNEKTLPVELTKSQVENLIEFIELNFIDIIRKMDVKLSAVLSRRQIIDENH